MGTPRESDCAGGSSRQLSFFGSAPMGHGLIDVIGDLDVLCRGTAWDMVRLPAPPR